MFDNNTPPQPPDINLIEYLWEELLPKQNVSNRDELRQKVMNEWKNISPNIERKLVAINCQSNNDLTNY